MSRQAEPALFVRLRKRMARAQQDELDIKPSGQIPKGIKNATAEGGPMPPVVVLA